MRAQIHFAWLICWGLGQGAAFAEPARNQSPLTPATNAVSPAPPLPPLPKSRVAYFRELLAMSPAELEHALARTPEPNRKVLQAKLREYTALPPEEREASLRATELRWYLRPLMEMAPTNRTAQVASIPAEYRALVEERLKQWDATSPETKKEVLENEWTISCFLRLQSASPSQRESALKGLSPALRQKLQSLLAAWLELPPQLRQRMCDNFQQFFELSPREQERTLSAFSDAERREMEKTLLAFAKLPPEQRRICIASFRKFANMTPDELAQFLKNAERWKEMSPGDRQTWRMLVTKLPPPPPGFGEPPLPPPLQNQKPGSNTPLLPPAPVNLTNVKPGPLTK